MKNDFDVIIVGTGPAGIFAAMELVSSCKTLKILMVEKGRDIDRRKCPMLVNKVPCASCPECSIISGWGGAGAFSDGKLTLSPDIGGFMLRHMDRAHLAGMINYVDDSYVRFGAPDEVFGDDPEAISDLIRLASKNDLEYVPTHVRHIGTDRCLKVLKKMKIWLMKAKVNMLFDTGVERILTDEGRAVGVRLADGHEYRSKFVILAPGREGSKWLESENRRLNLPTLQNPVDIGVRVEIPASVFEHLTAVAYEPKLLYNTKLFDDRIRTFCVNPYGEVVKEYLKGAWTVNGHSNEGHTTNNTNFALLVSTTFTEPFNEPIQYGRYIAGLATFLGKGVIVQRLGDLRAGRRSTPERIAKGQVRPTLKDATPGDLSFVLPYRYLADILEMLEALDRIAPGVNSRHTLLYGVEVKFYSMQMLLTDRLETVVENLFAAGDGAGVSRGLIQASVSGVVAAREILTRVSPKAKKETHREDKLD